MSDRLGSARTVLVERARRKACVWMRWQTGRGGVSVKAIMAALPCYTLLIHMQRLSASLTESSAMKAGDLKVSHMLWQLCLCAFPANIIRTPVRESRPDIPETSTASSGRSRTCNRCLKGRLRLSGKAANEGRARAIGRSQHPRRRSALSPTAGISAPV